MAANFNEKFELENNTAETGEIITRELELNTAMIWSCAGDFTRIITGFNALNIKAIDVKN